MNGKIPARFYIYGLLFIVAAILPLILVASRLIIVSNTYGETYTHFELFGFSASLWLLFVAWHDFRKREGTSAEKLIVLVPWLLTGLFFLTFLSEYSAESLDYVGYKLAAKAILEGKDPYSSKVYLYPPFTAQIFAGGFIFIRSLLPNVSENIVWNLLFYFYQCLQFFLAQLAFWLCYRVVRIFSEDRLRSVILLTALMVFNNPMIRTLRHNQVNLLVLDLLLLAILLAKERPWFSGFFNSIACHIKLYPFVFVLPWAIKKRWLPIVATFVFFTLIISVQIVRGDGVELWKKFLVLFVDFPKGHYYRDNSIHSVIFNTLYFLTMPFGNLGMKLLTISKVVHALLSVVIVLLFANRWRMLQESEIVPVLESIPLILLISPLVWEHHFIMLLPYALWNLSKSPHPFRNRAFLGALLIFAIPTFDLFPFSYHRIAGVLLMLSSTPGWKWNKA
jgi:hypothetical protein